MMHRVYEQLSVSSQSRSMERIDNVALVSRTDLIDSLVWELRLYLKFPIYIAGFPVDRVNA